jgi:hypothetical protein
MYDHKEIRSFERIHRIFKRCDLES